MAALFPLWQGIEFVTVRSQPVASLTLWGDLSNVKMHVFASGNFDDVDDGIARALECSLGVDER